MLIFDGHLDLAMNAVEWNRDLSRSLEEVRRQLRVEKPVPYRRLALDPLVETRQGA